MNFPENDLMQLFHLITPSTEHGDPVFNPICGVPGFDNTKLLDHIGEAYRSGTREEFDKNWKPIPCMLVDPPSGDYLPLADVLDGAVGEGLFFNEKAISVLGSFFREIGEFYPIDIIDVPSRYSMFICWTKNPDLLDTEKTKTNDFRAQYHLVFRAGVEIPFIFEVEHCTGFFVRKEVVLAATQAGLTGLVFKKVDSTIEGDPR